MAFVGELGVGAPHVMRRYGDSGRGRVRLQNGEYGLRGQALRANPPSFVERPKHAAGAQADRIGPAPDRGVHPVRNRDGPDAAVFANEIGDDPTLFPLL